MHQQAARLCVESLGGCIVEGVVSVEQGGFDQLLLLKQYKIKYNVRQIAHKTSGTESAVGSHEECHHALVCVVKKDSAELVVSVVALDNVVDRRFSVVVFGVE